MQPVEIMSALVPKVTRELTKMKRTLRDVFNLDKLRPGQAEVIRSVLEGENQEAFMSGELQAKESSNMDASPHIPRNLLFRERERRLF
jgi:hypothetical protein